MTHIRHIAAVAISLAALDTGEAVAGCVTGAHDCPIVVQMARGTDTITLSGQLSQTTDCCTYSFRARQGQTFHWAIEGAAVRVVITDPNGESDGPGLPSNIPLRLTGNYLFAVSPNLMAEGAFGSFRLTITIK